MVDLTLALPVIASLILGRDGSYAPSTVLSNNLDRENFLKFHREATAILIGGETARNEPYLKISRPLFISSKRGEIPQHLFINEKVKILNLAPAQAIEKVIEEISIDQIDYSTRKNEVRKYIGIEGGPYFLMSVLKNSPELISEIRVSWVEPPEGHNNLKKLPHADFQELLSLLQKYWEKVKDLSAN